MLPASFWLPSLGFPCGPVEAELILDTPSCASCVCLQEVEFQVDVSEHLGPLLFVKVQKLHYFLDDAWFCNWISVKGPGDQGAEYRFPCYRWVQGTRILSLPEGTGEQRDGV